MAAYHLATTTPTLHIMDNPTLKTYAPLTSPPKQANLQTMQTLSS